MRSACGASASQQIARPLQRSLGSARQAPSLRRSNRRIDALNARSSKGAMSRAGSSSHTASIVFFDETILRYLP